MQDEMIHERLWNTKYGEDISCILCKRLMYVVIDRFEKGGFNKLDKDYSAKNIITDALYF